MGRSEVLIEHPLSGNPETESILTRFKLSHDDMQAPLVVKDLAVFKTKCNLRCRSTWHRNSRITLGSRRSSTFYFYSSVLFQLLFQGRNLPCKILNSECKPQILGPLGGQGTYNRQGTSWLRGAVVFRMCL